VLSSELQRIAAAVANGQSDWQQLEQTAMRALSARTWQPDYVAIRRGSDLGAPQPGDALVVLAAAKLGTTRLIDNLELTTAA
jgi:pantoate--beta-alanine ligase